MSLLEVQGLTKYFGGLAAVNEVDFVVNRGEIMGLIGPNGAGKTTLYNVVSGVYKPTKGKVTFKGEDITGLKINNIAEKGLVRTFQLTNLFMEMTTFQSVVVAHHLHSKTGFWGAIFNPASARNDRTQIEQSTREILDFLGLMPWKDEQARALPHGQQRALGIAIAMAARPELLMLDEPVTGMNPTEIVEMMEHLRRVRERGITLMIVEHNMRAVMGICDRIVVLNFGRKIAEGKPAEIGVNQDVIEAYLGAPE